MNGITKEYEEALLTVFEPVIATGHPVALYDAYQRVMESEEPSQLYRVFRRAVARVIDGSQESRETLERVIDNAQALVASLPKSEGADPYFEREGEYYLLKTDEGDFRDGPK